MTSNIAEGDRIQNKEVRMKGDSSTVNIHGWIQKNAS